MTASDDVGDVNVDGPAAIELQELTKTYAGQGQPALADISLTIVDGQFFSLLGPSGVGQDNDPPPHRGVRGA